MTRFVALLLIGALLLVAGGPGFRSERLLAEHFIKHREEFGNIGKSEYLRKAQELRDAPPSGTILESKRGDVLTRFDKQRGYFGAYNFNAPSARSSYRLRERVISGGRPGDDGRRSPRVPVE